MSFFYHCVSLFSFNSILLFWISCFMILFFSFEISIQHSVSGWKYDAWLICWQVPENRIKNCHVLTHNFISHTCSIKHTGQYKKKSIKRTYNTILKLRSFKSKHTVSIKHIGLKCTLFKTWKIYLLHINVFFNVFKQLSLSTKFRSYSTFPFLWDLCK